MKKILSLTILLSFILSCAGSWKKNTAASLNAIKSGLDLTSTTGLNIFRKVCTKEAEECIEAGIHTAAECKGYIKCVEHRSEFINIVKKAYSLLSIARGAYITAIAVDDADSKEKVSELIKQLIELVDDIEKSMKEIGLR